jgi:cyclopropane fatty-acyl-phospholipid synthase-like methyltransferase
MTRSLPTPDDVGGMYDESTEMLTQALGGSIHVGYWEDEHDRAPIVEASERLTGLVAQRLAPRPADRLLDIGCGTGRPALQIARDHETRVTGITVSGHQLSLARAAAEEAGLADRVGFQHADAMKLPFADVSFDGAWAIESLLHMSDPGTALAQAARVVRSGGRLVVADLCLRGPVTGEQRRVVEIITDMFQISRFATPDEYRAYFAGSGWELSEFTDVGERVRPGYGHVAAFMRKLASTTPGPEGEQLGAGADLVDAFAALPEIGYVFATARRP